MIKRLLQRTAMSATVSVGLLALTNVDVHHEKEHDEVVRVSAPRPPGTRWKKTDQRRPTAGATAELRRALENVELGAHNPFAPSDDLGPLEAAIQRGVSQYQRTSFRSPRFQEESGYDLISFEITHPDHSTATIVAALERTLGTGDLVPVVVIVDFGPAEATQALYRAGKLIERRALPLVVARDQIRRRLDGGVPFLSAAR